MSGIRRRGIIFSFMLCFMFMFSFVFTGFQAMASTTTQQAEINLTRYVATAVSGESFTLEGGGTIKGSKLFVGSNSKGWELSPAVFNTLTSDEQERVVSIIAKTSQEHIGESGITDQTVQNWWKQLQSIEGVGTKFLNVILENTKPDFVTANAIYKPFSGVVGTIMGLGAVVLMAFLGIVMVADISYITLPPVRLFVSDDENGNKIAKSKLFSHDAIYAVQQAEGDSQGNGSPKQALGIYLKRRIFMLILLGICLMYLVQGQLYTFVGWILDLLNGFLGF